VQFSDGGIATGSSIYDAEKDEDSDVNITTQGGSVRPGATLPSNRTPTLPSRASF
jgi:hypothetical protein